MKTILTSFDFMQNFDFILTYKIYQNRPYSLVCSARNTVVEICSNAEQLRTGSGKTSSSSYGGEKPMRSDAVCGNIKPASSIVIQSRQISQPSRCPMYGAC